MPNLPNLGNIIKSTVVKKSKGWVDLIPSSHNDNEVINGNYGTKISLGSNQFIVPGDKGTPYQNEHAEVESFRQFIPGSHYKGTRFRKAINYEHIED